MIGTRVRALALAMVLVACAPNDATPAVAPSVPDEPTVLLALIEHHAEQFDVDLPERPAGSQEELAAATYITGHLQLAGYAIRLEDVPVGDLVESSNIMALPPKGDPAIVVAAPYDSDGKTASGHALGMFLEVARALDKRVPEHDVGFAALGAQLTARGATTGLSELRRSLDDEGLDPGIFWVTELPSGDVKVEGPQTVIEGPAAEMGARLLDLLAEREG